MLPLRSLAQSNSALAYTFTTFAGQSGFGSADGIGSAAQFSAPYGLTIDGSRNLYVADTLNHNIRKVTSAGVVSTIAGFPTISGTNDGTGSAVRFNNPYGIAVDSAGNLYVADTFNHTIRKINSAGAVSTLAGLPGIAGSADGTGGNARFKNPYGIVVDAAGNLYVADTGNSTIRKITPAGLVSTFAGLAQITGTNDGASARFNGPKAVTVDSTGNLFVADTENQTIRKITSAGIVSTFAGQAGNSGTNNGTTSAARFFFPSGITLDSSGNLYVADNSTIRKITPALIVSTLAGSAGKPGSADGTGNNARFSFPSGVAVDSDGSVYVSDFGDNTIRKITSAAVVSTIAGLTSLGGSADGTGNTARFFAPQGIAVDIAGNLYVGDTANNTVRKITAAGVVTTLAGLAGSSGTNDGAGNNARFNGPAGVAVDGAGNLYVADSFNDTIRKITPAGIVSTFAGLPRSSGSADGTNTTARFFYPTGIAIDSTGNLFVADTDNNTIRKITPAGVVSTFAGLAGLIGGNADGTGSNARFQSPQGIAVDGLGNVIVADTGNGTIRKITPARVVSTLPVQFMEPEGVAVDSGGVLYVSDNSSDTIQKISPPGAVSFLAGGSYGSADGTGSNAQFYGPEGIVVDSAGHLYVADTYNNAIRKGIFTQYAAPNSIPYTPPPTGAQLTISLLPPEASGQWRFPWEFGWHNSGFTASNLVAGNYPVEFRNVPGWVAIPLSGPVTLGNGEAASITNQYYPTLGSVDTNSGSGTLTVSLGINSPSGAGWRFLGDTTPFMPSGSTNLTAGTYLIEFAFVTNRVTPSSQAVQVNAGQPSYVSVSYLLPTASTNGFYLPFPVPANEISDLATYPFTFNGQLQSDVGYGSGVAVSSNVVLTAAHLVFNDQSLAYVTRAHWFFQREAGIFEPLPQVARGWLVLSGYAAQRTNDLNSGYSPDQSTPPSRNYDVAALFFDQPVAGGGHGGYLPSDAVPNTWLTSTALKMLVGYPVDGSQFGANVVAGQMYQTDPQPYQLSLATDPVPGQQQVYTAPWFLSYPGNSGGPLYVQLNGYYYPVAVYLGTLFSGSQPYASAVRAIDSEVVNLITASQEQVDTGTNHTGGGVITVIPGQVSSSNPGYLQFQLAPPAAVQQGAAWRLQGDSSFSTAANYIRTVTSTNAFTVEFKSIPGWNSPTNQSLTVQPGLITIANAFYTVTNPVLVADLALGLGITGTTGTVYRIESRNSLNLGSWLPISTNTIISNGVNPLLTVPPNQDASYFRVVWLP
jgi:sugar lactone lactonase YvrE